MIPGIIGSQQRRRLEGGVTIPDGAISHLDFLEGIYYAGGSTRAVQQILGGSFDISSLQAKGMNVGTPTVSDPQTNFPTAIGSLFADIATQLLSGITLVYELDISESTAGLLTGPLTNIFNDTDPDAASEIIYIEGSVFPTDGSVFILDERTLSASTATLLAGDIKKVAVTLYRDAGSGNYECAISGMGVAAVTDTVAYAPSYMVPQLIALFGVEEWGSWLEGPVYVRKLTVYPAVAAASLHEYSEVS